MALGAKQKVVLGRASSIQIESAFQGLSRYWRNQRWLGTRNRYSRDCVSAIKADLSISPAKLRVNQIAAYIAASSPIHCMDGWTYLARSIGAELSGATDVAKHLAYYAELRAAMSILATCGLGIFDKQHITVANGGVCDVINGTTHVIAWDALEHWGALPTSASLLLKAIKPGGVEISEWLKTFSPSGGTSARTLIAQDWLVSWGLDLRRLSQDRTARNLASYRPSDLGKTSRTDPQSSLRFVIDFWRLHEPSMTNVYKTLDRYLLRRSLAMAFRSTDVRKRHPKKALTQYTRFLRPMLHSVLPTAGDFTESEWLAFLTYESRDDDPLILNFADSKFLPDEADHNLGVMARATLLLRLATGLCRNLMLSLDDEARALLSFWWEPLGRNRGLWSEGDCPADTRDLWTSIEESIDSLEAADTDSDIDRQALFRNKPTEMHQLSSCERIGIWSLST